MQFSVLINGSPMDYFKPEKGLRQGNPLSPCLYILVGEALSRLILGAVEKKEVHGLEIKRGISCYFTSALRR